VQRGNAVEAELLLHLAEVDARQLYLEEGCSSMFTYCQQVLHFAEGVAYKRIQAARAASPQGTLSTWSSTTTAMISSITCAFRPNTFGRT
jgi:hypothetical protein